MLQFNKLQHCAAGSLPFYDLLTSAFRKRHVFYFNKCQLRLWPVR